MFFRDGRDENSEMLSKLLGISPLHPNCQKKDGPLETLWRGMVGKRKKKKKFMQGKMPRIKFAQRRRQRKNLCTGKVQL